jgi:hypothetical protein
MEENWVIRSISVHNSTYNGIQVAGYGNASAISFELGANIACNGAACTAGVHVNNPLAENLEKHRWLSGKIIICLFFWFGL